MQRFGKALCALVTGLVVTASLASWAHAQSWPQRPVRFIVSLGPGSGADIAARLIADKLTAKWRQPVVVENRPGGDAVIAINALIGAKDDHVLLYTPTSSFTAHPFLMAKMPYDPNDLEPIARDIEHAGRPGGYAVVEDRHRQGSHRADQSAARQAELRDRDRHDRRDLRRLFQECGPEHHARAVSRRGRADHRCQRRPYPGLCRRARNRAAAYPGGPRQADRSHQQSARADARRIRRRWRRRASPS